jgi:hypothetical protein
MRFIPTKIHGILDYLVAIVLMSAPWLFNFDRGEAETWIPVLLGVATIVYSMLTDYEWGMSRAISMKSHLVIDLVSGIFLAASPWIFGFYDYVYLPHLILGIIEIGAALTRQKQTMYEKGQRKLIHSH